MGKGTPDAMKALIERTRAHQAEFVAKNPDFLANEEAEIRRATEAAQPITAAASTRLSKKKRVDPDAMAHDFHHRKILGNDF